MTTLSNFILFARGGGGGEIPESYLQSSAKFSRGGGGVSQHPIVSYILVLT